MKLGEKEESIKKIVGSLGEALKRYEQQVSELEKKRASDQGSIENQIKSLLLTNQQLQKETGNLVSALKSKGHIPSLSKITIKIVHVIRIYLTKGKNLTTKILKIRNNKWCYVN